MAGLATQPYAHPPMNTASTDTSFVPLPDDGQEFLRIDGHAFEYLPQTHCTVSATSDIGGDFVIDLKARLADGDLQALSAVLGDEQDVFLRFPLKGIYRAGVPTGRFSFARDRDAATATYVWKGGFRDGLSVHGDLLLENGWIGFSGYLQGSDDVQYAIAFAKRLPLESVDWTQYRFTSLDELFSASATVPRHLQLIRPAIPELPAALFDYTALESLVVACMADPSAPHALQEIPAEIARLQRLHYLALTSIGAVREIPPALGALHALRRLYIKLSQATFIAPEILALPALEYCSLSHNQLQQLPTSFTPSLQHLEVDDNQLTQLPDALASLPNLRFLDISRNPLTGLPPGLDRIETLRLELDKKIAFLDYTYRGAGGRGTVAVDHEVFLARHDPALLQQLDAAMSDEDWDPYREAIRGLALRSVALSTTAPDDYTAIGITRFGGLPDLPYGIDYPTFSNRQGETKGWQFIAQLNCADLASHQAYLPRAGMLYFFITGQGDICGHVIHAGTDTPLRSAATLSIDAGFIDDDAGIYTPWRVAAASWLSVPTFYSSASYALGGGALDTLEDEPELSEALGFELFDAAPVAPIHAVNSYVFMQHDTPQIEAANALRGHPEDFMVLLRVSSDDNPGFCFSDAGEIFFVIHKSDLALGDFSNVYCGLESS